jgi:chemotaxis protein MotB
MNRRFALVTLVGISALGLGGCVAQDKYDSLSDTAATSGQRVGELNQENQTLAGTVDVKQRRIDELESEVRGLRSVNDSLNSEISGIRSTQQGLLDQFGNLKLSSLDPETDAALAALAAQYPDLIEYDASRGLIRFKSDLTFDSGSDVVKPQARQSLQRLAQILANSSAMNYDLRVVGHTDNVTPTRTASKWPTNRHLGAYRAISVANVLREGGVSQARMEAATWGEFRPAVANNPRGGTAQNRRVEIYVVPGTGSGIAEVGAGTAGASSAPAPAQPVAQPRQRELPVMK